MFRKNGFQSLFQVVIRMLALRLMTQVRARATRAGSACYAKVRNVKVARGAVSGDAALKVATTAYFKACREIGSRGEFYGVIARRFTQLT